MILTLCITVSFLPMQGMTAYGTTGEIDKGIPIDEEHFPDRYFREALMATLEGEDGFFSEEELLQIEFIDVDNYGFYISSIAGIHYFQNLKNLDCGNALVAPETVFPHSVEILNLSNCGMTELPALPQNLKVLKCNANDLTELPPLPKDLKELYCSQNKLTAMPVIPEGVEILDVSMNPIKQADTANLPSSLTLLRAYYCELQGVFEVDHLVHMETMELRNNQLTSIAGLQHLSRLEELDVQNNQIGPTLDVSCNHKLNRLFANNNLLTKIYLYEHMGINRMDVSENLLIDTKDVSGIQRELHWDGNNADWLKFSPQKVEHQMCSPFLGKPAGFSSEGVIIEACEDCDVTRTETIPQVASPELEYDSITFDGEAHLPQVAVQNQLGLSLEEGRDYDIIYDGCTKDGIAGCSQVGRHQLKIVLKGNYEGVKMMSFVILPPAAANVKAVLYGHDDVKVSWKKTTGADGYYVYYKNSKDAKYSLWKKTTAVSMKIANLRDGESYRFKVIPYFKDDQNQIHKSVKYTSCICKTMEEVTLKSVKKASDKQVKLTWSSLSGVNGYQISKSTKKSGTYIVATYKTTSGTYKTVSATKGKTYYYKVRAYKTVTENGTTKKIFGPWSDVKAYKRN